MNEHNMWEDEDVRSGLRTLVSGEPPFGEPTAQAVDDAVRRGRKRRIGRTAAGGAGVAVLATVTTVALVGWQSEPADTSAAVQPAGPAAAPAPAAGADALTDPGYEDLASLVEGLGGLTGPESTVTVQPEDETTKTEDYTAATAVVEIEGAGALTISASLEVDEEGDALETWDASCVAGAADDKPCEELARTADMGAWAATYTEWTGREQLTYVAATPSGALVVVVNNFAKSDTEELMGPSWSEAGLTVDAIDGAVRGAGFLE